MSPEIIKLVDALAKISAPVWDAGNRCARSATTRGGAMKARVLGTVMGLAGLAAVGALLLGGRCGPTDDGGPTPLEDLTRAQLYERAKAADIAGRSGMTKAELIAALRRP